MIRQDQSADDRFLLPDPAFAATVRLHLHSQVSWQYCEVCHTKLFRSFGGGFTFFGFHSIQFLM
jgi:hypothetical protein